MAGYSRVATAAHHSRCHRVVAIPVKAPHTALRMHSGHHSRCKAATHARGKAATHARCKAVTHARCSRGHVLTHGRGNRWVDPTVRPNPSVLGHRLNLLAAPHRRALPLPLQVVDLSLQEASSLPDNSNRTMLMLNTSRHTTVPAHS
jgi:hypothetical protein